MGWFAGCSGFALGVAAALTRHSNAMEGWNGCDCARLEPFVAGRVDLTMNIKGSGTTNAGNIRRPARKASASPPARPSRRSSQVTPTELSRWIKKAKNLPEVRQDLVEQIKREIADGTYETPEKIQIAVERMLEEFG